MTRRPKSWLNGPDRQTDRQIDGLHKNGISNSVTFMTNPLLVARKSFLLFLSQTVLMASHITMVVALVSRLNSKAIFLFATYTILFLILPTTQTQGMLLQGKRVLVTGGGRGIGRAIAQICHQEGARVAVASRTLRELEETLDSANNFECKSDEHEHAQSIIKSHVCDVTSQEQVESMVKEIVDDWGGVDILINNAGGAQQPKGTVDTLKTEALTNLLQLNVVGVHIVTSAVLRLAMTGNDSGGHILNISSKAGKVGLENYSFYVASKFALEGMTSSWAKELKKRDIVVNSLSPGMVNTQSFPKPEGKAGVRSAESIRDALLLAITAPMKYTGHYIHADELDLVRKCELPDWSAWKPIDEEPIEEFLPPC